MLKNPKECFSLVQKQTFFILNALTSPTFEDGSEPLLFHHETFSRFTFVIINAEKKAATANIHVSDIPGIIAAIKDAHTLDIMKAAAPPPATDGAGGASPDSPAYTVIIASGNMKGKTPAALLMENPNNRQQLLNQRQWLANNLSRYPKNSIQIGAIDEAVRLFDAGKLDMAKKQAASAASPKVIYSSGFRPLVRRMKNGKTFVYEIAITWNGSTKKPVGIEIKNYYATVIKTAEGLLNVQTATKEDQVTNTFYLEYNEWLWAAHALETNISTFEILNSSRAYRVANEEFKNNAFAARAEKEAVPKGGTAA